MDPARRLFLAHAGGVAALAAAGGGAWANQAVTRSGPVYPFALGVASGSPLPDAVMLWTRILDNPLDVRSPPQVAIRVSWEVAEDEAFTHIAAKGTAIALPQFAHSVHADATGLAPDRWYFFRFMLGDAVSPVGRTRTAPAPDALPGMLKLALASCQHWEFGHYAAHGHIARAAPDLVAFIGDYIYERGPFHIAHPPTPSSNGECMTLADYRARYAQYKSDPQLQAAHLAAPWIMAWDDHEVANDYANDRDERLDPNFLLRRAAAYQAFYEHMPLRLPIAPGHNFANTQMFQRFDWGRLARFHVLDDRQYRAWQACTPEGRGGSSSVAARQCADLRDPRRTMLGATQEAWLAEGLASSRARWNVITQQTLMAQCSQVPLAHPGDGRFWTDGWDGYPAARRRLLESLARTKAANPLVLGGDVHTFYAAELRADFDLPVSRANPVLATEFVGTSITSTSRPQARTQQYVDMNPHLKFGRSDKRGYALLEITPDKTTSHFLALDDAHDPHSAIADIASFRVDGGKPGLVQL